MNTLTFIDEQEALAQLELLKQDETNVVDAEQKEDGTYRISWIKAKKYISFTGDEHTDEVWVKEDGTMLNCQDIELEHARNIIRMMIRNERQRTEIAQALFAKLQESGALDNLEQDESDREDNGWADFAKDDDTPRVLH